MLLRELFGGKRKLKTVGEKGEDLAARFLKGKGYSILERNFKNDRGRQIGEIDIIAKDSGTFVFVEVKSRECPGNAKNILPEEKISREKLHRMEKVASFYLRRKGLSDAPYRFDAVSVIIDQDSGKAGFSHLESIFF